MDGQAPPAANLARDGVPGKHDSEIYLTGVPGDRWNRKTSLISLRLLRLCVYSRPKSATAHLRGRWDRPRRINDT